MGDLAPLHAQCMRLIIGLREGLERLERAEAPDRQPNGGGRDDGVKSMAQTLRLQLKELQRTSAELDSTWRMHVVRENPAKREVWKRKVEQVSEAVDSIRTSLDRYGGREQRRHAEAADREELLTRGAQGRQAAADMDAEAQAMGSVQRSRRYVAEIYESGTHILTNMAGNRERLKRTHKRMLDVLNSVGMGEAVLRLIERRQRMNIWTAYVGMAFITIAAVLLLWWVWA